MSSSPSITEPARVGRRWLPPWLAKASGLSVASVVLGWAFAWAQSGSYGADRKAGFWVGLVHGAVMPAALPCLLAGKDVPIFNPTNTGRTYRVVFFGLGFRPASPKARGAGAGEIADRGAPRV